jgi:glycosyltransferase involved in cell wall biosynthesis
MALAKAGAEVGLWAPDQSAQATVTLAAGCPVRRLIGTEAEALDSFGKVDVVHDNGIWLPHNHRLAKLSATRRIPRVVSTRGMLEPWAKKHKQWKKHVAWKLYQRRDLKRACCHHATAEAEARNVQGLELGVPVRVIPNGIDVPESDPIVVSPEDAKKKQRGKKIALFLGRINPKKGLPMLVEAWARVRPEGWLLQIAGPDEAGHRIQVAKAVSACGLCDVVSFVGAIDAQQKQSVFHGASLFVLPTHSENFGMAIAEALAHSLPVLTTTGAPWSILSERGCGWWVDPTVDGIAEGLRRSTSHDLETLRVMGERGRELVAAEFGWDHLAAQYLSMYEDCLGG